MKAATSSRDAMWTRLRYTPLRDLFRLRISGRLDMARLYAEADLPQPLTQLVQHVVRRTRLSRLERADVAHELVAHFVDGLASGTPAEQLRESFGDADQAARLIRRAKRRCQSPLKKMQRYTGYALGVLALFYLIVAIRFFVGSPSITTDYLAQFNHAAASVPAEQAAWPQYRQALLMMDDEPKWEPNQQPLHPDMPQWPEMRAYLQQEAEAMDLIRHAGTMPGLGFVAGFGVSREDQQIWPNIELHRNVDESLIGVLLPYLNEMRRMARLLHADAHRAALEGDEATVMASLIAMVGMSEQARELPTLINELVAMSLMSIAMQATVEVLVGHADVFSDASLQQLAHRLAAAHGGGTLHVEIGTERLWFYDFVQRLYTDDGDGNGRITVEGIKFLDSLIALTAPPASLPLISSDYSWLAKPFLPATTLVLANRRDMVSRYEELITRAEIEGRLPLWRRIDTVNPEVQEMAASPIVHARYFPIVLLMPAFTRATITGQQATLQRDGLLTSIALILHHRRHGHWPEQLDALVPGLLPSVPVDRFDGQPLRYRVVDGSPVLYSIGGNLEDNGGTPPVSGRHDVRRWYPPEQVAQMKQEQRDGYPGKEIGDWVLWPPVRD